MKYVPRGKAIWNANGGFVSVLLTHLLLFFCVLLVLLFNFVMHCIISTVVVAFEINCLYLSLSLPDDEKVSWSELKANSV